MVLKVTHTQREYCHQGWGQVHWYLYLRTLFAVLVLILKSYISFVDVLVLKYISMYFEYLM